MIGLSFVNRASKSRSDKPVRMLARRLQLHQIHDVDDADFQFRQVLADQLDRGQRFKRRNVAATGHDHIGFAALVVAGPFPNAEPCGAMLDGLIHR